LPASRSACPSIHSPRALRSWLAVSRNATRRGADLAYLAALPSYLAEVRRSLHEADLDAIATVRAATASKHEGRRQRRQLPKGSRIRTVAP
jgi:hypothetical protein